MNVYKDAGSISAGKAIKQIVEVALSRGTYDKILLIDFIVDAENYATGKRCRKELNFVFYRPSNYTFVGLLDGELIHTSNIKTLSYHDSCWSSDGVDKSIYKLAEEVQEFVNAQNNKNFSIHTTFGLFGARVIEGRLKINDEDRTAKFVPMEEKA